MNTISGERGVVASQPHHVSESTKELRVLIFGWFLFPFGSAGASRVRHIAKGLIANNAQVKVLTIANIDGNREQKSVKDDYRMFEDVQFRSSYPIANHQGRFQPGRLLRVTRLLLSIMNGWRAISSEVDTRAIDVIYLYGRNFFVFLPVLILCRLRSIPVAFEINEWPPASNFPLKWLDLFFWNDFLGRQLPKLGGARVVAITTFIRERYARRKVPVLVMPSIKDFTSASRSTKDFIGERRDFKLVYAGSCKKNDGFGDLLDAVESLVEQGNAIRLEIVGNDGTKGAASEYKSRCDRSATLRDCVFFNGFLSETDYAAMLQSASCLVVPRPNCVAVKAAFPTRVPEFLATGNAVITSVVPDIPEYLEDGVDVFLYDPDEPRSLENTISRAMDNPEQCRAIGRRGKITGEIRFCHVQRTNALLGFLTALKGAKKHQSSDKLLG
jgi:glycosyltransferase involved in cell wall biosynthesis